MSFVNAFQPTGSTVLVTTSSVQITTSDNVQAVTYRIRNVAATQAYLSWLPADPLGAAITVGSVTAPTAGSPSAKTLGFAVGAVEVFTLPPNVWMKSDTANAFEVTPGVGL